MSLPDFISIVPVEKIDSPCVNVCTIGRDRQCQGCRRTIGEIARWTSMTPAERDAVMAALPRR
ncbi:MAG: DUF1289 domain-containing protein [Pseudomonadota bacterium]